MTSDPPRSRQRKARPDLWRYRTEAGGGQADRGPGIQADRRPEVQADRGPEVQADRGPEVQPNRRPEVQAERDGEVTLVTLGYLGAVFTGPVIPLGVYLIGRRISPFTRYHAAMALNLSLTGLLYAVCCLILGGVLLLDSLNTALIVALPITVWLWVCTVGYLLRGVAAANRGESYAAPAWICARIAR